MYISILADLNSLKLLYILRLLDLNILILLNLSTLKLLNLSILRLLDLSILRLSLNTLKLLNLSIIRTISIATKVIKRVVTIYRFNKIIIKVIESTKAFINIIIIDFSLVKAKVITKVIIIEFGLVKAKAITEIAKTLEVTKIEEIIIKKLIVKVV